MRVNERVVGDQGELERRIAVAKNAKQRDRLRAVALALKDQDAPRIARMLGRSRRSGFPAAACKRCGSPRWMRVCASP